MGDAIVLPAAGDHGGDAHRLAAALGVDPRWMIDLSASMNPFAPDIDRLAMAELAGGTSGSLTRYPDAAAATTQLATAIGVLADRVLLTNGAAEAIALVAAEVRTASIVEPEFSLYRRHLDSVDDRAPRWRSNPSNPLGDLADSHQTSAVWDEAFYPIATGTWTRGDDDAWRIGSLTKLWSCPGLRLGYVIAPDLAAARRLALRQPQWSVNGLALALVRELLDRTDLVGWHGQLQQLRGELVAALLDLGFDVRTTDANWVLVQQPELRMQLAVHGIIVRDCASFGLPGLHRVAVPRPDQLGRVIQAFAAVRPVGAQTAERRSR